MEEWTITRRVKADMTTQKQTGLEARRPPGTGAVSCFLSFSHLDPLSVCICFKKKKKGLM